MKSNSITDQILFGDELPILRLSKVCKNHSIYIVKIDDEYYEFIGQIRGDNKIHGVLFIGAPPKKLRMSEVKFEIVRTFGIPYGILEELPLIYFEQHAQRWNKPKDLPPLVKQIMNCQAVVPTGMECWWDSFVMSIMITKIGDKYYKYLGSLPDCEESKMDRTIYEADRIYIGSVPRLISITDIVGRLSCFYPNDRLKDTMKVLGIDVDLGMKILREEVLKH